MLRKWNFIAIAMLALVQPALAGPPYLADDPEPAL
jgi:hypothetical protein